MKTKTVVNAGLAVALTLLRLTSASADVLPPLKSAAGGALFILDLAMKFHFNKQQWLDLAEYVAAAIACVIESLPQSSSEPRADLHLNIQKLADTMHRTKQEISSIRKQSGFARALAFGRDPDKILGMRKELDDALSLFHLRAALVTGLDVARILDGVDVKQLLENVNAKLSDTIVSAINLNAIPCAEGASWDPNPINMCLPNTRVELLKEFMDWIESPDHDRVQRVFWLSSVAGGGKTAVANTVAKLCHEKGFLAASFFFDRKTAGRNDPKRLFSTLARGLASYSPEVAAEINRVIEEDQSVATSPIFRQFEELLRVPSLRYSGRKPIIFVVDALDEGLTIELLQILRDQFPQLRNIFRFFVTSRPEPQIISFLANQPHVRRFTINIHSQNNVHDIGLYVEHELHEVAMRRSLPTDWPGAEQLKEFIAKAGGLFIWVSVVSRYLCRISYPEKKLALLLSKVTNHTLTADAQMDAIYAAILESCDWEDEDFVEGYHLIMGAITVARTPLSIDALRSLHCSSPIRIEEILRPIGSLIASDLGNATQPVHILHLSLQEFLTARAQLSPLFSKFHLENKEHSQRLAYLCLTILNAELQLDIPGTGFLEEDTPESELPGIPDLTDTDIPEVLWYACQFWIDHLMDVDAPDDGLLSELETFLSTHLARWLEILTGRGQFQNVERVRKWIDRTISNQYIAPDILSMSRTAALFDHLSSRLTYMDRREHALDAILEAVELYRQFAADRPAAFNTDLANSLNNLSTCLSDLGRREDALDAIHEAVELRRQLAADRPTAFNPDLAMSLNNLSACLSDLGRREDALDAIREAIELRRYLAADRPAAFNPDLAMSLTNLSAYLSGLGRREDALDTIREAVELYRQLAVDCPAAFNPDLANSLNNLSNYLSREDALDAIREAVELRRHLAANRPAAFNPDLAMSLNNLSIRLSNLGRREDALDAIREAVELCRHLAADRPAAFNPDLAMSLTNLSAYLSGLGRREDALDTIREAVELYRQLAVDCPAAFNPDLANSLNNLSNYLSREDALDAIREAVELRRHLAANRPAAFNPDLAMSLNNLSIRLSNLGRPEDALDAVREAVELRRQLAADRPTAFNPDLAMSLTNLSACLSDLGRREDAQDAIREAVELYRQLAADRPTAFNPDFADSLNNLSYRLSDLGPREEALDAIHEAVALRRKLAAERPALFNGALIKSLNVLSTLLTSLGRDDEAIQVTKGAQSLTS